MSEPVKPPDKDKAVNQRPGFIRSAGKILLFGFLSLFMIAATIVATVVTTWSTLDSIIVGPLWPAPPCDREPIYRVALAGRVFYIPRAYRPGLSGENIRRRSGRICQGPSDPPIKVNFFSITTWTTYLQHDEALRPIHGVRLFVIEQQEGSRPVKSVGAYPRAKQSLQGLGVKMEHLPIKHGFHVYEPTDGKGPFHYVAVSNGRRTPMGLPLSFSGRPTGLSDKQVIAYRSCSTAYALSQDIHLEYRFRKCYSVETLRDLDERVRSFLKNLETKPE